MLRTGICGLVVHSSHVVNPFFRGREDTFVKHGYASRSRFSTLFLWAPLAVAQLADLIAFADVMIVPDVLIEMILAFEAILSSILLAVLAGETLSVLLMGSLMSPVCVQSGKALLAVVVLADERGMTCGISV